jgi:hypothetical protein
MVRAATMFCCLTQDKAADEDFSLWEIDQAIGELNALQDALECAKAQFEAACEDAGGEDYRGDKSERVRFNRSGSTDCGRDT